MTSPAPATLEREKDKLFVTDAELIRRMGVPEKTRAPRFRCSTRTRRAASRASKNSGEIVGTGRRSKRTSSAKMVCLEIDAARVAPESRPPQSGCRVVTLAVLPAEEAMPTDAPKIDDTPGLIWRRQKERMGGPLAGAHRSGGARIPDQVASGVGRPRGQPDAAWRKYISGTSAHHAERNAGVGRGGIEPAAFTGTIASLIACYRTDPDSTYHKLRYKSRVNYDVNLKRLEKDAGDTLLTDIKARGLLRWHEQWSAGGKVAMGHSMIAMLRSLFKFGKTILEDPSASG
jgi:hypothetical protein